MRKTNLILASSLILSPLSFGFDNQSKAFPAPTLEAQALFLDQVARKFAPELRAHEDEQFPIANAEWYLTKVGLKLVKDGKEIVLIPPGQVTIEKLDALTIDVDGRRESVMQKNGTEGALESLELFIPSQHYDEVSTSHGATPACYAFPHFIDNGSAIEISYSFFHPYNGTVGSAISFLNAIFEELGVGHHESDWEHITVRVDKTGNHILGVYYATHGSEEGRWYHSPNRDLSGESGYKIKGDGQVVTWSTVDTHGNHNRAGTIHRDPPSAFRRFIWFFGILADKTSDLGRRYDCRSALHIFSSSDPSRDHPWLRYRGRWGAKPPVQEGENGTFSPAYKSWWHKEP